MTADERLAALAEHGRACPQAVKLGGPATIEAWCAQQELEVAAERADAEAAEAEAALAEAEAAEAAEAATEAAEARAAEALATAEAEGAVEVTAGDDPEGNPNGDSGLPTGALAHVLARLDALEADVAELKPQGPPLEAVAAVAASPEPEPKPKKPKAKRKPKRKPKPKAKGTK